MSCGVSGTGAYDPADVNSSNVGKSQESRQQKQVAQSGTARYHKVQKGETLSSIARKRGTTVDALCKLNRISKTSRLRIGQILKYS